MTLEELWNLVQKKVFSQPSTETLFNQYHDIDSDLDRPGAAAIRISNLKQYLASFGSVPRTLLVGEAPGPRGCRFSGVPFTSESQLCNGEAPFLGEQSSLSLEPYREVTATVFWTTMRLFHPRFLAWNCVPFHPHEPGIPLSVRNPDHSEIARHIRILEGFCKIVNPEKVIAIGRHAQEALETVGVKSAYVRHPSKGGVSQFRTMIAKQMLGV